MPGVSEDYVDHMPVLYISKFFKCGSVVLDYAILMQMYGLHSDFLNYCLGKEGVGYYV